MPAELNKFTGAELIDARARIIRAGRSVGKSNVAAHAMLNYVERVARDKKLLQDTLDEDLPLLVNHAWGMPSLENEYKERYNNIGR